jgi:hypothetical protein
MLSGVDLGKKSPSRVEVVLSSTKAGVIEIWLDDLATGNLIATIPVSVTGGENNWKTFRKAVKNISGHHDVFIKFMPVDGHKIFIRTIRFLKAS